jgi:hypothetical protein
LENFKYEIYFQNNKRSQPQRIFVQIKRPNGAGIGLSIVAAQGAGDRYLGIYVKKVVEGSIAYRVSAYCESKH